MLCVSHLNHQGMIEVSCTVGILRKLSRFRVIPRDVGSVSTWTWTQCCWWSAKGCQSICRVSHVSNLHVIWTRSSMNLRTLGRLGVPNQLMLHPDNISTLSSTFYPKNNHWPYFWCYGTTPVGQIGDQPPFPQSRAGSSDIGETIGFCPWAPKTRWRSWFWQEEEKEE